MAVTTATDLVSPEALAAQMTWDKAKALTIMAQTPAVSVVEGTEIWKDGAGADEVKIRYFDTDTSDFVKDAVRNSRNGVTPSKLSMNFYTETAENKTVSIDGDSFAFSDAGMQIVGDHLIESSGQAVAEAYQRSLIRKAMQTALELHLTGEATKTVTVDAILDAKMQWGENASAIVGPVLFLHSKQYRDLAKTADFKSLAGAANPMLAMVAGQPGMQDGASPIVAVVHGVGIALLDAVRNSKGIPAISSITRTGAVATVTTASAHGLLVNDKVQVSGATEAAYNGTQAVASVPSDTTFTFAVSGSPSTPATGTPVFTPIYCGLLCAPGALQLMPKKDPTVEIVAHAGSTVKTFDQHFRFATTLRRVNPRGVIKLWSQ